MASSTQILTDEEKNFIRFSILNFKVSPPIVRTYFDTIFPPTTLAQILNQNMNIIQSLIGKKRITSTQEAILRRIPGTVWKNGNLAITHGPSAPTSSSDFDLTLMICLMRNIGTVLGLVIPPSTGWDKLPNRNDKSLGAFLARIKFYRNELAHSTVSTMSNIDFQYKWSSFEEALINLNSQKPVPEIADVLKIDLDGQNETLLTELKNLKAAEEQLRNEFDHYKTGNLPRNIAENMENLLKMWENEDEKYYETSRCELFIKMLSTRSHITVTGSSGSGKSALVRHAALHYQNAERFSIITVEEPEQIMLYKTNGKQIFIVDDVLGKYRIKRDILEKWERNEEKLNVSLESIKILCTLRTQVARTREFKSANTLLNKNVFDLENKLLSDDEKEHIFMKHLTKSDIPSRDRNVSEKEIKKNCTSTFAFPLLCKLVTSDCERFKAKVEFFSRPFKLFKSELEKLLIYNRVGYCGLVICMIFNGQINRSDFYSEKHTELIRALIEGCGLIGVSRKRILDNLEKAIGSYTVRNGTEYKFIHDRLFESVSSHFAHYNTPVMLRVCNFEFIRDRVRIGSKPSEDDDSVVFLDSSIDIISHRMFHEVQNGNFANTLLSLVVNNEEVVEELCKTIANRSSYFNILQTSRSASGISIRDLLQSKNNFKNNKRVSSLNHSAILRVMEFLWFRSKFIYWLVAFNCYNLLNKLWNNINESQRRRLLGRDRLYVYSKPLFPLSILAGNIDIINLFLPYADINCYSECGETSLSIAIMIKRLDIAKTLLQNGASINKPDMFRLSFPLLKSVEADDIDIIDFLVEKKVDFYSCDIFGNSLMSEILYRKSSHFLRNLLQKFAQNGRLKYISKDNLNNDKDLLEDSEKDILNNDEDGVEDLVKATLNDDEERVEKLLKILLNNYNNKFEDLMKYLNRYRFIGLTLIQVAVALGFTNIAKLFLSKKTFVNGSRIDISPLHIAVKKDNIELAELCLEYDACGLDKKDLFGKTPFHYVKSVSMANILTEFIKIREKKNLRTESKTKINLPFGERSHLFGHLENPTDTDIFRIQDHESQDCHSHSEPSFGAVVKNVLWNNLFMTLFDFNLPKLWIVKQVNVVDPDGNTVLHDIAKNKSATEKNRIIETIVENGGNKYIRNRQGDLPYDLLDWGEQSTSPLKVSEKYTSNEECSISVFIVIYCLFVVCSIGLNVNRYIALPNNQQECLLEEMPSCISNCNETITSLNAVQYNTSSKNFEILFSFLMFVIFFSISMPISNLYTESW